MPAIDRSLDWSQVLHWGGWAEAVLQVCSENDEICSGNDGFRIQNDGFCIKNDGFRIQNDGFCIKNDGFRIQNDGFCIKNDGGLQPEQEVPSGSEAEFCIKNKHICSKNERFCIKNEELCIKNDKILQEVPGSAEAEAEELQLVHALFDRCDLYQL